MIALTGFGPLDFTAFLGGRKQFQNIRPIPITSASLKYPGEGIAFSKLSVSKMAGEWIFKIHFCIILYSSVWFFFLLEKWIDSPGRAFPRRGPSVP